MEKLTYKVKVDAPKEKVWDVMLGQDTYPVWTEPFMPGSNFEGSWDEGSKIRFTAPNQEGKLEGMVSTIAENRPHEFISIKHLGELKADGTEDYSSPWAGATEDYTFKDADGGTELLIDLHGSMDIDPEMAKVMDEAWPKALKILKELAEK